MKYEVLDNKILFEIDRIRIADIAPGDSLDAQLFPGATYTWTEQDSQFMESNPEAGLYLKLEKNASGYVGKGIAIFPAEVSS
jgi:hypothetical protein